MGCQPRNQAGEVPARAQSVRMCLPSCNNTTEQMRFVYEFKFEIAFSAGARVWLGRVISKFRIEAYVRCFLLFPQWLQLRRVQLAMTPHLPPSVTGGKAVSSGGPVAAPGMGSPGAEGDASSP